MNLKLWRTDGSFKLLTIDNYSKGKITEILDAEKAHQNYFMCTLHLRGDTDCIAKFWLTEKGRKGKLNLCRWVTFEKETNLFYVSFSMYFVGCPIGKQYRNGFVTKPTRKQLAKITRAYVERQSNIREAVLQAFSAQVKANRVHPTAKQLSCNYQTEQAKTLISNIVPPLNLEN